jgi:hypothetical protein
MPQENISGNESLALIESMINKAKNQFSENGHLYLLWGWAVLICSIAQFILIYYVHSGKHSYVWFATWVLLIYQVFYIRRKKRQQKARTYTDEIIGFVWLAFFILMCLFGFQYAINFDPDKYYGFIFPAFLVLYGMPTFLSGVILKFKPLILGGIYCWALSVAAGFIPAKFHLLLLASAMIAAWIIPGYLLRKRFKNQTA